MSEVSDLDIFSEPSRSDMIRAPASPISGREGRNVAAKSALNLFSCRGSLDMLFGSRPTGTCSRREQDFGRLSTGYATGLRWRPRDLSVLFP